MVLELCFYKKIHCFTLHNKKYIFPTSFVSEKVNTIFSDLYNNVKKRNKLLLFKCLGER